MKTSSRVGGILRQLLNVFQLPGTDPIPLDINDLSLYVEKRFGDMPAIPSDEVLVNGFIVEAIVVERSSDEAGHLVMVFKSLVKR